MKKSGGAAKTVCTAATCVLFVLAAVVGLLAHRNLPVARRAVVTLMNALLAPVLAGRIVIERVGRLGPTYIEGAYARVDDPQGFAVLHVSGLSARLATWDLLRSFLGHSDVRVELAELSIAQAEVNVDTDRNGGLRLAQAFALTQPAVPSGGGRGVSLRIPHALLKHVSVRGQPPAGPLINADVDATEAAVNASPGRVAVDVIDAQIVEQLSEGPTIRGTLDAHFEQPAPGGGDRLARATWRGTLGALAGSAQAAYDAGKVDALVDVPTARPECVRDVWRACPFGEVVSAHFEAHGTLPKVLVTARAGVGRGSVVAAGQASLDGEMRANLRIVATSIDAHALSPSAPPTDLAASGDVAVVATAKGRVSGTATLDVSPGTIGATRVPPAVVTGELDRRPDGALAGQATVAIRAPGASARVALRLLPKADSFQIAFDAIANIPHLHDFPHINPAVHGEAHATAHGTLDLGAGHIDAGLDGSAASIEVDGARVETAAFHAHAVGALSAPWIDAALTCSELKAGPFRFDTLQGHMQGALTSVSAKVSLHAARVNVSASATANLVRWEALRDLRVVVDRNGESARGEASLLLVSPQEVSIDNLEIQGVGAPLHGTLRWSPEELKVQLRSHGVDLSSIGRLAGFPRLDGRLVLDVDAVIRRTSAKGRISLDLSHGSFDTWHAAHANINATLDGLRASGHLTANIDGIGTLDVRSSSLQIGSAGPLEPSSWKTAWGQVDVAGHVDLAQLSAQLAHWAVPMRTVSGTIDMRGHIKRDSAADSTPEVDLAVSTKGLALTGNLTQWRLDGIGAALHAHVDERTGTTSVDATLADVAGAPITLRAWSDAVPYARLFSRDAPLADALIAMPFRATITVPPHDIAKLPAFLGTRSMEGSLQSSLDWQGSVENPTIDVHAALTHGGDNQMLALPVALSLTAHGAGTHADVVVLADAGDRRVLEAHAALDARLRDLLGGEHTPWTASAHATMTAFPLGTLAILDDRQVRGNVGGSIDIDGLHRNAQGTLDLTLTDLQVGDATFGPTTLRATANGHSLDAWARIVGQDGYAEAKAHLGAYWGTAFVPSPDSSQPTDVRFAAKNFQAAAFLPLFTRFFTELKGRIDGNVHVRVDAIAKSVTSEGCMALSDGVFALNGVGGELHDAKARATFAPDGIRLDNASAHGTSGRVHGAASARIQGENIVSARALVEVPHGEPLPLVVDGTQIGMVDGRMEVTMRRAPGRVNVDVDVPVMRLQAQEGSERSVQALGPLPDVQIGIVGPHGVFKPIQIDGPPIEPASSQRKKPIDVTVRLGGDVEVRRGSDLDVRLEGTTTVTVADSVTARGQIRLARGTLSVQGRVFHIGDGSTVTFIDDPTDPQVKLTASWVAASSDPSSSGTTVFATFVGPLKTGIVTLRSEPPLPKSEILALLLYGTVDQRGPAGAANGSAQIGAAGGVAGAAASANVNHALGALNRAFDSIGFATQLSTKVNMSQATPEPEVDLQVSRDLSFQIAWVLGIPSPGSNPDQTLTTVAWRFLHHWHADVTVGNAGTTIFNLVWQRRY